MTNSIAYTLHILLAMIWVGGMFFAHMMLRPSVASLNSEDRLYLWKQVFGRFFLWVWTAVVLLPVTGVFLVMTRYHGFGHLPLQINIMLSLGSLMILFYIYLFFFPYRLFNKKLEEGDLPMAAHYQKLIRYVVTTNLALGLIIFLVVGLMKF